MVSAVRYLVELGHRRIGFVAKEPEHKDIAERLMGYRESFGPLGLDYDASVESIDQPRGYRGPRVPEPSPPVMDELVDPLLKLAAPPTALIVPSDWQSIGVYRALAGRGVRIPDDVCVIGFDNEEHICHSLVPTLTSLEYPAEEIGRQAVRMLVRRMKEGNGERQDTLLVKSVLVVRGSTGRPNL